MKYLKTFEFFETQTGQLCDFEKDDIVISQITNKYLIKGREYKVLKIYQLPEDKFLVMGNPFLRVDVENLETGEISRGWKSTDFKIDYESISDLYNL